MRVPDGRENRRAARGLPSRQRRLLALLDALGGRAGNLDFQKLLFLYCHEPGVAPLYDFVPYKYGAFSFTSYADRRRLIAHGLVNDDDHSWEITDLGTAVARKERELLISAVAERYRGLRGDALVAETYRRFPYYATHSRIAHRVLRGNEETLARIEAARHTEQEATLLSTIGYEGRSLEAFLNALLRAGVTVLCDVRRNPISRKYGFSKGTLANSCGGVGIRYEHLPELGIPSEERKGLQTREEFEALFGGYERETLPKQGRALERIMGWLATGQRVALTCYERHPEQCHRHCVAEALERIVDGLDAARHL